MTIAAIEATEELIRKLDEKHPGWNLWRTADLGWVVKIKRDGHLLGGPTLTATLAFALEHTVLPRIPRQPELMGENLATIRKVDGRFAAFYDGKEWCGGFKLKRDAVAFIDRTVEKNTAARAIWVRKYFPLIDGKTEGVDFIFED